MGAVVSFVKNWNSDSQWWHWSYLGDWALLVVPFIVWVSLKNTAPKCRDFNPTDPTINHPFANEETFPNWSLPLVSWLAPLAFGVAFGFLPIRKQSVKLMHEIHSLALCLAQAVLLAMTITDPMKNYAGRHRPDFVSRLHKYLPEFNGTDPNYLSVVCSSTNHRVWDGMKSFPSGHASMSFAGWVVIALLVSSRIPSYARNSIGYWRVLLLCFCLVFPSFVAISRTIDYRHNFSDITAGTLIGVFSGMSVFKLHFTSHSAYPINRKTGTSEPYEEPQGTGLHQTDPVPEGRV
eukprot:TRINITY_DN8582_c0_g1_i2.p1 TRINITY_DN8582_c0_g1~~TRINITY_DN8582_c0_g1_i2.p1  ORF type:complete len:309 (+),score=27.00 TRINITY_DN8582_c0_g1_i2:53-928(+)